MDATHKLVDDRWDFETAGIPQLLKAQKAKATLYANPSGLGEVGCSQVMRRRDASREPSIAGSTNSEYSDSSGLHLAFDLLRSRRLPHHVCRRCSSMRRCVCRMLFVVMTFQYLGPTAVSQYICSLACGTAIA